MFLRRGVCSLRLEDGAGRGRGWPFASGPALFPWKWPGGSRGPLPPTGKECDLNRQCGVINPETKKICTRLLTCKVTPLPAHGEGGRHRHGPRAGRGAEMFSTIQLQGWGEAQTRAGEAAHSGPGVGAAGRGRLQVPASQRRVLACGGVKRRHADTPANTLTPPLSPLAQARAHRCPSPLLSSHPPPHPSILLCSRSTRCTSAGRSRAGLRTSTCSWQS